MCVCVPNSPCLLHGSPERKTPARVREAGLGARNAALFATIWCDETEAVKGFGLRVVLRVFHHALLRDDDPVLRGDVGTVGEGEGRHHFPRHADLCLGQSHGQNKIRSSKNESVWEGESEGAQEERAVQMVTGFIRAVSFMKLSRRGSSLF